MSASDQIRDEVRSFCPIPPGSPTVDTAADARATLLEPQYTTIRDVTPTNLYRDERFDFETRLASFFNAWPMFAEGPEHQVLRRLTRQITSGGTEAALAHVDRTLDRVLPLDQKSGTAFDWEAQVAVPVSTAVVQGLVGRILGSARTEELIGIGAALMVKLSGRDPGIGREQSALLAGVRLADLADRHRASLDLEFDCHGMTSEQIGGALAQVLTGALDPLQAAVAVVPLHPGEDARSVVAAATPFRFVKRIDSLAPGRHGVRVPLLWPGSDGMPFGLGSHRCTAASLTERVVERVIARADEITQGGKTISITAGNLVPAAFLRFEDLWVSIR